MENKFNDMEDFFRNKLTIQNEPTDGWDLPDAEVWTQARRHIAILKKSNYASLKILSSAIGVVLILFLGAYMWWQYQEIKTLENELINQNNKIEHALQMNAELEKKYKEEKTNLLGENKKINIERKLNAEQKIKLEEIVGQQKRNIYKLKEEINSTQNNKRANDLSNNYIIEKKIIASAEKEKTMPIEFQKIVALPLKEIKKEFSIIPELNIPNKIIPIKKKSGVFEIGYENVSLNMSIPSTEALSDSKNIAWHNLNNKVDLAAFHGLSFAYSPKRNLFIRTGFRKANATLERDWKYVGGYDKSKEYEKPNGDLANDLALNFSTPYSVQQGDVGIDIPSDVDLKEDDLLVLNIYDYQEFSLYQIPLGLEYYFGNGSLQWQIQGGARWNKMVFGEYIFKAEAAAKNHELTISKVEVVPNTNASKEFLSAYGGLGLDYRIASHWHARAALTYDFNFIKSKSSKFSNSDLTSRAFNLGLNYRF